MQKKTITLTGTLGFIYEVKIKNYPHLGFSIAFNEDKIIAEHNSYKIYLTTTPNMSDTKNY